MDHARPTTASTSHSVAVREERPNVIISSAPQSVSTHTSVVVGGTSNAFTPHNDVVDEYDDDLDAAMMNVDLGMFDEDLVDENQTDHRGVTEESSPTGVSSMPMELLSRTTLLKSVSDVLTIVKDKCFHGTLRIKVSTYIMYINIYICMYVRTYVHTYIRTCMHAYMRTYRIAQNFGRVKF